MGSFIAVRGLLSTCGARAPERVGSEVAARELSSCGTRAPERIGSVVAEHGLSCPTACGNFSSPTRYRTHVPCIERQVLNHQTTREVPWHYLSEPGCDAYHTPQMLVFSAQMQQKPFTVSVLRTSRLHMGDAPHLNLQGQTFSLIPLSKYLSI